MEAPLLHLLPLPPLTNCGSQRPLPTTTTTTRFFFFRQQQRCRRSSQPQPLRCGKMFVPGFGEASPEAKAAKNMQDFFTFVAVKVVLGQLQSYNPEAYGDLMEFVDNNSLSDGDEFCRGLMRRSPNHKALALRILEVRSAYSKKDFEWENMKKLSFKMVDESNTKLMREYILETSHMEDKE